MNSNYKILSFQDSRSFSGRTVKVSTDPSNKAGSCFYRRMDDNSNCGLKWKCNEYFQVSVICVKLLEI
ncbi:hypothetical protein C0J52_24654 [Blattella germanica]|nr:hypothetical protein C0J52_24654 [Blattella germanica]